MAVTNLVLVMLGTVSTALPTADVLFSGGKLHGRPLAPSERPTSVTVRRKHLGNFHFLVSNRVAGPAVQAEPKFAIESPPSFMQRFIAAAPRVCIGLAFVMIGFSKFDDHSSWVALFQQLGAGTWFRYFTGGMQFSGVLVALLPRTAVSGD